MNGWRGSSLIACAASIAIHAAIVLAMIRAGSRSTSDAAIIRRDAVATATPEPSNFLGAADATGFAIAATDGTLPFLAPEGPQDQPALSLDPVGMGIPVSAPPEPMLPHAVESLDRPMPFGAAQSSNDLFGPLPHPRHARQPDRAVAQAESPDVLYPSAPVSAESAAASGSPFDPAPEGESEIDPFSILGGEAKIRNGRVEVRLGRAYKIIRPRMSLAAFYDAIATSRRPLKLKIGTNADGDVISVDVIESSLSETTDQTFRVAAYDWWFEPPKDDTGHPKATQFPFTIVFQ